MQDIHNSLNAKMPINFLMTETELSDLFIDATNNNTNETEDFEALQLNIASFMAATNQTINLPNESTHFEPKFMKKSTNN